MLVTEEEAKTKWCPHARVWSEGDHGASGAWNRALDHGPSRDNLCIGSACMAWRAGTFEHQRNLTPQDRTPNVGYCGLAGKP